MVKLKLNSVKASTLLEVIVAMVIILIVFAVAINIFTKVVSTSPSVKQQQIRCLSAAIIEQSLYEHNWTDESVEIDSIVFQKTVVPYRNDSQVLEIVVIASERGKELGRSRQIIRKGRVDVQ